MMAPHRPEDPAPPPPAEEQSPGPATKTTLPTSPFLAGFDWILALGVLTLAFLVASFSVRNSDFWMHLAAGRLLAEGKYEFGKDPFSYVGADRAWVNHAWLFDWLLYLVFKAGGGPGAVIVKAIGVALAAGLLLLARKPGQSVFPGVACVGLALIAAAPRLLLQPTIASLLFLATFLFLVVRVPKRPGSWTFPVLVAVVFGLWANCDQWFFLGPLFLLLYTVGQYIRPDEGEDTGVLWKALGVGVLACTLNPHHVRVWTLPPELVSVELQDLLRNDTQFGPLVRGGLDKDAWDFTANPANPTALIVLLALCVVGYIVNYRRLSVGLVLVWVAALAVAALHSRAIPFLAFVSAPVAAVNLAAAGRRVADTPMSEGNVRLFHALRSGGRAAVGIAGLLLIALTYPGWVHPFIDRRRWNWDVEPSPSMVRAAEKIQQWHDSGALPPEARLLNLQPDFANYVAWFAPSEKTFFDYRLRFHADEAAEYLAVRRYLAPRDAKARQRDPYDLGSFLRKYRVTYAVCAHPSRAYNFAALDALWGFEADPVAGPDWVLWHVEGWAVILGWTKQDAITTAQFDRLRFDPLRAAYVDAQPLPVPEVRPPLPPRDVWEQYVMAPPIPPAEGEETLVLLHYQQMVVRRAVMRHAANLQAMHYLAQSRLQTPALTLWTYLPLAPDPVLQSLIPPPLPPEVNAVALLAVRAARRAIATSPDHSDGYFFLAKAYSDTTFQVFPEQRAVITASLGRCLLRLPEDPAQNRSSIDVFDLCNELGSAHQDFRRLDLLYDVTRISIVYLRDEIGHREGRLGQFTGEMRERLEKELEYRRKKLEEREKQAKAAEVELRRATDRYINQSAGKASPFDRAVLAVQAGLYKEAIDVLRKEHERLQKQLLADGDQMKLTSADLALQLAVHAALVELLMDAGEVEQAAQILDAVDTPETVRLMGSDAVRMEYHNIRRSLLDPAAHYRRLRQTMAFCIGDFDRAAEAQQKDVELVLRDLKNFKDLNFPTGAPDGALPLQVDLDLDLQLRPAFTPFDALPNLLGRMARGIHVRKVAQFRVIAQTHIDLHVRLALTRLEQGDVPTAVHHFRQAVASSEFTTPIPTQLLAQSYLRAIEKAQMAAGAVR